MIPTGGGAATYKFASFSQKLHEIKKILVRGGGGCPPPGPATATYLFLLLKFK